MRTAAAVAEGFGEVSPYRKPSFPRTKRPGKRHRATVYAANGADLFVEFWCRRRELNPRPGAYETPALAN